MDHPAGDKIEAFVSKFKGKALTAGDPEYDSSRAVWNGAIDRKPAVIARCADPQQVASAVRFAREAGLEISVRGGGHNYAGTAVGDGGLMVHLGAMNQVSVDPAARRVRCGGGATWGDLDAATQSNGLATPGGIISHTGAPETNATCDAHRRRSIRRLSRSCRKGSQPRRKGLEMLHLTSYRAWQGTRRVFCIPKRARKATAGRVSIQALIRTAREIQGHNHLSPRTNLVQA